MNGQRGRRAATSTGRGGSAGRAAGAVLVAVAVVAVLLVGAPSEETGAGVVRPTGVRVDHVVEACPRSTEPGGTESRTLVGSAALPQLGDQGRVTQGPVGGEMAPVEVDRGELVGSAIGRRDRPARVVDGNGEMAAGLFTFQVDRTAASLAVAECAVPAADWWFSGAGATLEHTSELLLTNVDPGPAVVDVRVFGEDGEVETLGTRGVMVAPGSQTRISLTDVAPQGEELAISVTASRGRVVAAVADSYASDFGVDPGAEWIPAQPQPRRQVRLAGLPADAESRSLLVGNPSESEAVVDVEVVGKDGSFAPAGVEQVRVPPGSVVATDIGKAIGRENVAVRLRAQVPIVATVRSTTENDATYAAPVSVLRGPAAVPLVDGARSRVLVSSAGRKTSVEVTTYTAGGEQVETKEVDIAPGGTSSYRPPRRADYVVVTPGGRRVYGAVSVSDGTGVSQIPLAELPIRLQQPAVHPVIR